MDTIKIIESLEWYISHLNLRSDVLQKPLNLSFQKISIWNNVFWKRDDAIFDISPTRFSIHSIYNKSYKTLESDHYIYLNVGFFILEHTFLFHALTSFKLIETTCLFLNQEHWNGAGTFYDNNLYRYYYY